MLNILPRPKDRSDRFFQVVVFAIIALGIFVRIAVLFQNRNLFIDEANIARNIFERNIFELATPLSYEQYAPPVFLWMLKLFTTFFGYGEVAFRIFPFIASLGSIMLLYLILKEFTSVKTLWYPVALFVVGYMSIRYSTELKQYISDILIVLGLILTALKTDIFTQSNGKFVLIWAVAGSIAIWGAMPSVFTLAGIGSYYFWQLLSKKELKKIGLIVIVSIIWLAQFALYYLLILKPQIESSYLQNFHQDYFLFATPDNASEWQHNWNVIKNLIQEAGGFDFYAFHFNLLFLIIGIFVFLIRETAKSLLILVPLGAVLFAAALNQYSLIPRVALFMTPLILILIGYGIWSIARLKPLILSLLFLPFGIHFIYTFSSIKMAWEKFETEEITDAMHFAMNHRIYHGNQLYIHNGARPAFIYYTQIHPEQGRWDRIKDAHLLQWDADYSDIAQKTEGITAFIFTSVDQNEMAQKKATIEQYNSELSNMTKQGSHVFIYQRKQP